MFCGECGVAVVAPVLVEPATKPRPGDTAIIQPLELAPTEFIGDAKPAPPSPSPRPPRVRPTPVPPARVAPGAAASTPVMPAAAAPAVPASAAPVVPAAAAPVLPPPVVSAAAAEPVHARITLPPRPVAPKPGPRPTAAGARSGAPAAEPLPMPTDPDASAASSGVPSISVHGAGDRRMAGPRDPGDLDDLEETRIVAARLGDRFVLQFSTGENSIVYGTGLVGRNPVTQPGEYVDQLVTIVDPGKSVSKTHLEFGQTAGAFWIVDRYSANGTIVRQPDAPPQRLDPGKRQPIARGTRVDMGEQFFVVS